jgi:hypothetical protein
MKKLLPVLVAAVALWVAPVPTQEREDRTLLNWDQMRAIINEASGDRALHTVQEMVPYPRVRPRSEYEGHFRESEVMARLAREAGFSGVEIESFQQGGAMWNPIQAELWMVSPEMRKLYDVYDVAVSICSGSESGDVTADLVDVGVGGRAEDYANIDVKGKIVLGSAGANQLQRLAVFDRGAVGVISYNPLHPLLDQDQIGSQSVASMAPQGRKPGFGWSISPRAGYELSSRLGRGEKLTFRSIVKAETFPGEMETVHAVIPGDGSSTQAVAMSGHLYEGYLKQGANDDASGCAVTLEMGRALIRLVADGKLPKPKRDIHFLWVPEISGTTAWLNKHQDVTKRLVADLNFDMEGLGLAANDSMFVMHRTPDTFPTWLNDVGESMIRFVAELNRERVRYRSTGYGFTLPVVSPAGSVDPLYFVIDKFYGASDHVVYMGQGIPSLMFITWPDKYYHSSHDVPEKLDPTQLKRVAVIGLGGLTVVATADDAMAARVAAETVGRGTARVGEAERKGLSYLADVTDTASLADAYKDALNAVRHQVGVEKAAVQTASVLFSNPTEADKKLALMAGLFDVRASAIYAEIGNYYKLQADIRKVPAVEPTPTPLEQRAARLVPERVGGGGRGGVGGGAPAATPPAGAPPATAAPPAAVPPAGGGGGRGGAGNAALAQLPEAERAAVQAAMRRIPGHMTSELNGLMAKKKTVLEIRNFISGEFEPVPLADVMAYFEAQAKLGSIKLNELPEETKKPAAKKK